jgi:hypothetical protein
MMPKEQTIRVKDLMSLQKGGTYIIHMPDDVLEDEFKAAGEIIQKFGKHTGIHFLVIPSDYKVKGHKEVT